MQRAVLDVITVVLSLFAIFVFVTREEVRISGGEYWIPFESQRSEAQSVQLRFAAAPPGLLAGLRVAASSPPVA